MTDIEMNPEVEAAEFTEELSDEALDREGALPVLVTGFTIGFVWGLSLFLPVEVCMSDVEMKIEVEAEDFTEELSDEALDREAVFGCACGNW